MGDKSTKRPTGRRRLTADQRRESILQAAEAVFATSGYRAGTIAAVAEQVGVTEPVIFQNFGSKAALFAAVLERISYRLTAERDAPATQQSAAPDLLHHVLASPQHHGGPVSAHGVLFADAAALASDPVFVDSAQSAVRAVAAHLADIVRQGQHDGEIRGDIDPDTAGWLLLSLLAARSTLELAKPQDPRAQSVASLAIQILLPPG